MGDEPGDRGRTVLSARAEEPSAALEEEWDVLAGRVGAAPFVHPAWFSAWHRAFAPSAEQVLLTVRAQEQLLGVLPLLRRGRALSTPKRHCPWFTPVALTEEVARALLAGAVASGARRLDVAGLDVRTAQALGLEAALAGAAITAQVVERSPVLDVSVPWTTIASGLSRSRAKHLRQWRRRLDRVGEVHLGVLEGVEAADALLTEGVELEARSWKGEYGMDLASHPSSLGFYRDVVPWTADRGMLRVTFLRVDGRAVAYGFDLSHAGTWYGIRTAYDPEYRDFGPGMLLTEHALRHAADDPTVSLVDHCGDDDAWKRVWSDRTVDRLHLGVFAGRGAAAERTAAHLVQRGAARARQVLPRDAALRLLSLRHGVLPRRGAEPRTPLER